MVPFSLEACELYFKRAVQALHTEDSVNAARWTGSLLHYITDSGSPPHAARISGKWHTPMENGINAEDIVIGGYVPQLLGEDLDMAILGLRQRLDKMVIYCRERGLRMVPLLEANNQPAILPIMLECALETARVTADALHTLGHIGVTKAPKDGSALTVMVVGAGAGEFKEMPAKAHLLHTPYATLADSTGLVSFRHLPPGSYTLSIIRQGYANAVQTVTLTEGQSTTLTLSLMADSVPGNLLRNADVSLRFVQDTAPDGWLNRHNDERPIPAFLLNDYRSEGMKLVPGKRYRLQVVWLPDAIGSVAIGYYNTLGRNERLISDGERLEASATSLDFVVPKDRSAMRLIYRSNAPPHKVIQHVAVSAVE
jgi:hypothetical protein